MLALLIAVTPRGAEVAILEARYSDSFNYLTANEYYAEHLGRSITYIRAYGDDYQHLYYKDTIIQHVKSLFPDGTRFGAIEVMSVQTTKLFSGWASYYEHVVPTVTVQANVPETYGRWDLSHLPDNIIVEGLL